jgi:hypothetical protein
VRKYQTAYFRDMVTPPRLEVRPPDRGPACYVKEENVIFIHPAVTPFLKLCRVLILHELIHGSLYKKFGDPDEAEGEPFQAERQRLWCEKAYADLL